jgi:heavy metal sensor kinase
MAIVLGVVGTLLHLRVGDSLQEQLDASLEVRAEALASLVEARGGGVEVDELGTPDEDAYAQVMAADGSLLASSAVYPAGPAVSRGDVRRAAAGGSFYRSAIVRGLDNDDPEQARLLATPVEEDGETLVLVVVTSADERAHVLGRLRTQLLIVGPLALILSSLAGYLLAAAALRPVERMRHRAAEISTESAGRRLPLPAARDEIRRLGETVNAMLQRLETGLERERRFVADASHELRTPLALLRTELELALRRPRGRDELEAAVHSAADEVDRLARLAEDLLVLARADEHGLPLRHEKLESQELLDDVARRFGPRADVAGRRVEVDAAEGGTIMGDRLRLEQALGNLVDNALRHGAGTISLAAAQSDGRVELRVADDGSGFPADFLPRAFDRFARADAARASGAAGLGLAIVDVIARAHGGSAAAANGATRGAVVILTLPAA